MKKNTLLITGGAGYIGSHTCMVLLEKGYHLIVIDSFVNSSKESLERVKTYLQNKIEFVSEKLKIVEGDIRNELTLRRIFSEVDQDKNPIEAVIHFAGLKSVEESVNHPLRYWDFNVNGSIALVKVMKEFDCKTIIFSSSASIYGCSEKSLFNEDSLIAPQNPYASTKMVVEEFLNNFYQSSSEDIRVVNLRYFNPIGAHESELLESFVKDCQKIYSHT